MAITHFLLQPNFSSNPLLPTKWSSSARKTNYSPCCIKTYPKSNIKCFITTKYLKPEKAFGENKVGGGEGGIITKKNATETNIIELFWRSMENVIKALTITGVLLCLVSCCDHYKGRAALAASGGMMGGDSFDDSSSDSSSYTYSSSDDDVGSSYIYSTQISNPTPMKPANGFQVIMTLSAVVFVLYFLTKWRIDGLDSAKTSVLKLQVGSLGTGRSLQKDLNRIAESADTSTSKGFNYVLQEAIQALLRHSDNCISGYSSVDATRGVKECKKQFNKLSFEERGKFDEVTLVNVNNIRKKSATSQSSNGLRNEYIVVTIIVAARGVPELPPIKSSAQLKKTLQMLASIPSSNIMGAQVLWTPQKEDDSLTEQEMRKDYPMLHPF